MLLMVLAGFLLVRCKILKAEDSTVLSKTTLYLVMPAVLLITFQRPFDPALAKGLLLALGVAVLLQCFLILLTRGCFFLRLSAVERGSLIYPNSGNLILPLVAYTFGNEWLLFSLAFLTVQTFFLWTHGWWLICNRKLEWKRLLLNVNLLAVVLGLILFFLNVSLPDILRQSMSRIGDTLGPLSMLVIGMVLGEVSLDNLIPRGRQILIVVLRLVIFPGLAAVLLSWLPGEWFHGDSRIIFTTLLLATAAPPASMITMFAQLAGREANYASQLNLQGMLLCIFTMPAMIWFYEFLCA